MFTSSRDSAENEFPGWGGIEIFTQPGADKWHGAFSFDFNDESLNSRSPFTTRRAPYQQRAYNVNLSGPIMPKKASFSFNFGRYLSDANSIVNATTLDPVTLKPVTVNQSFVTPDVNSYGTARFDLKVNKMHTLVGRFNYNQSTQDLKDFSPLMSASARRSSLEKQLNQKRRHLPVLHARPPRAQIRNHRRNLRSSDLMRSRSPLIPTTSSTGRTKELPSAI